MIERSVVWEDQDAYGHVHHTKFMHYLSYCYYRIMECYDEQLKEEDYNNIVYGKRVMLVIRKTELDIKRQVKYPDTVSGTFQLCDVMSLIMVKLIAAYRQKKIYPDRNSGTTSLFSLKQQRIVAETKGAAVYVDAKTGRPVDNRTLGGVRSIHKEVRSCKQAERTMGDRNFQEVGQGHKHGRENPSRKDLMKISMAKSGPHWMIFPR